MTLLSAQGFSRFSCPLEKAGMPMDFLRRIKDARFPLEPHDEADIRNSIVLEAAELIKAQLPGVGAPPADASVIIFRITPQGRAALSMGKPI